MKGCKRCMHHHNGFTLIEVLLAMMVISIAMLLLVPMVRVMNTLSKVNYESEDYVAIAQLRVMLAQGYNIQGQGNALQFRYHAQEASLQLHNRRLVKRPGYEIFMQDIDEVFIHQQGDCYELTWIRKEKVKTAILTCE